MNLSQVDPREAGEIAYMLANGSGKARASKNGAARSRHEWRLLFLSAGEIGLAQHIRDAGKKAKAGQTVRLVDIPADAGQGFGIFDTLHGFTSGAALSKILIDAAHNLSRNGSHSFLETSLSLMHFAHLPATIKTHTKLLSKKICPLLRRTSASRL